MLQHCLNANSSSGERPPPPRLSRILQLRFVRLPQPLQHGLRAGGAGDAQVLFAQLGHEFLPQLRAAPLEQ